MIGKILQQKLLLCGLILCIFLFTGCQTTKQGSSQADGISFDNVTASIPTYRYTLQRTITVDPHTPPDTQSEPQTMTETLDLLFAADPIVTSNDSTQTLKVTCKSIRTKQTDFMGQLISNRSIYELEGKSFTLKVSNDGDLLDDSELQTILSKAAENSLKRNRGVLLKDSDMLSDVEAIPYTVFAVAAKVRSENDFTTNQQFTLTEPTPWPVGYVSIPDHTVTSTVDKLYNENGHQKTAFSETYAFTEGNPLSKPAIYPSEYRMADLLGYMRKFTFDSITGTGEIIYNMDTKQLEKRIQNYTITGTAAFTMPIQDAKPTITITQSTTVELK